MLYDTIEMGKLGIKMTQQIALPDKCRNEVSFARSGQATYESVIKYMDSVLRDVYDRWEKLKSEKNRVKLV